MSSVNYSLKHKGVKLIPSEKARVKGKNGKLKLNPNYHFVGKIDTKLPNLVISAFKVFYSIFPFYFSFLPPFLRSSIFMFQSFSERST